MHYSLPPKMRIETRSWPWRWIVVAVLFAMMYTSTVAAEITVSSTKGGISRIVVEGAIEKGDHERLLEMILTAGVDIETVSLSSPGGDALEAIRLGRLIRLFGLSAEAPKRFSNETVCPIGTKQKLGCSCDSACLFLYLGATHRYGDSLGVHRVYLNPEAQRRLSLDESRSLSRLLEEATRQYFEEMRAPTSLLERVNSAASDSLKYLTNDYVEQNLYGYARDIEDWLIAKCGSASRAFTRFYRNPKSTDGEKALTSYKRIKTCFDYHLRSERLRNFRIALAKALDGLDTKFVLPNSLIAYARRSPELELASIVGMRLDEATQALAAFGLGYSDPATLKSGEGYVIRQTLTLSVSASRTISSIQINFFGEAGEDTKPFTGQFLKGFDQNATPQQFIAKYGAPFKQGRLFGGNTAGLWLESAAHDIWAIFDVAENKLRSVQIDKPGYWRSIGR